MLESKFSFFPEQFSNECQPVFLGDWIDQTINPAPGNKPVVDAVLEYRATGDKSIKSGLPACTPGGLFTTKSRVKGTEISRTGLLTFDIDSKDNPQVQDWPALKQQLHESGFILFTALSTSGNGLYGLIKISDPYQQRDHFNQLIFDFKELWGINLDTTKGKNCNDLRIYSYDPKALVSLDAEIYDRKVEDKITFKWMKRNKAANSPEETIKKVRAVLREVQSRSLDLNPGCDYETYRALAWAFCDSAVSPHNRELFHEAMKTHSRYSYGMSDKAFTQLEKSYRQGKTTIGTFFSLCQKAGINLGDVYKSAKI